MQWRSTHSTCGVKPSSAIRSASSSTTTCTDPRLTSFDLIRSMSRSGVATTISDAAAQLLHLIRPAGAAVHGEHAMAGVRGDRLEHLGHLDRQLAGRHEHEAERTAGGSAVSVMRASIGTPNASVLPEPVRARPQTSRPCHRHRDGRGLDHERLGETHRREPDVDAFGHAELGKPGRCVDRRQRGGGGEGGDGPSAARMIARGDVHRSTSVGPPARSPAAGGTPPISSI